LEITNRLRIAVEDRFIVIRLREDATLLPEGTLLDNIADFRRTFATQLREHNVHAYDIKYLLGHAIDKGETKRYARESLTSLRRAIETLNEPWGKVILFQRGVG
jgi:integrase